MQAINVICQIRIRERERETETKKRWILDAVRDVNPSGRKTLLINVYIYFVEFPISNKIIYMDERFMGFGYLYSHIRKNEE